MRVETRRQHVALFKLSWERAHQVTQVFSLFCACCQVTVKALWVTDLNWVNFSGQVNLQYRICNDEDWLYTIIGGEESQISKQEWTTRWGWEESSPVQTGALACKGLGLFHYQHRLCLYLSPQIKEQKWNILANCVLNEALSLYILTWYFRRSWLLPLDFRKMFWLIDT